jgi:hypothetical protein
MPGGKRSTHANLLPRQDAIALIGMACGDKIKKTSIIDSAEAAGTDESSCTSWEVKFEKVSTSTTSSVGDWEPFGSEYISGAGVWLRRCSS